MKHPAETDGACQTPSEANPSRPASCCARRPRLIRFMREQVAHSKCPKAWNF